ncbi:MULTISPECIES: 2-hydroxyacid dehydrogenase [Mycolicibacterium]|uniref:Glyoxylate reductase n=1 Tax=Mycolicibacterium smegmatis (strain MKD8) TaxID=1214915 RepID=A0A2U9PNX3_MYCSE|nr:MULTISPECIES: D-glycerate dehydrogenase [Mycolicibacterium]EID16561.1 glyoxylate reductase [Mycolicibacterium phlei RIVM601174]OKH67654.1 glyoxylate reductase [Mycobacterium sp. SWH-M5]AWT53469.1 glyoxylate reductase [Mycolicibacterium smegmatis MKD8]MBF4192812.1 glyoxylate reductase [Mycolicibacterium phlei]UGU31752.1 D-glycerate dehydrogenase [Mycolicibacterium smegmatis]
MTIYVSRLLTDRAMAHLGSLEVQLRVGGDAPPSRSELEAGFAGADAAIVTLTERVDAELLAAAGPQLKIIANVAVGYDNIDVEAAAAAGVTVTNTPGVLDRATADHTFALILAATRRVLDGDRLLRSREPWVWGPRMLVGLDISASATLGILGFGRIGKAVAQRAKGFDMEILATARSREPGTSEDGVRFVDIDTLLSESDVLSVLTPLTPQTRHLIDADALAKMKPSAYLVNTARGGVVDESALMSALHAGRLRGAALDVFENEPHIDPRLLDTPNLVLTPHIASAGESTRDAMGILAVDNAAAVLAGKPALTPVR